MIRPARANPWTRYSMGVAPLAQSGRSPRSSQRMAARKKTSPSTKASSVPRRDRARRDPAIDAYLARASPKQRALLRELRTRIHAILPGIEECISYRLPAFRLDGRVVAGFSATSNGCSFYPFSGTTLETLAADVVGYSRTKGALHFDAERPLPASLVRKLLEARMAEGAPRRPGGRRGAPRRPRA